MFLRNLELKNYRNVDDLKLDFDKNINIFIGNNAQGKTNILESIYYLAITKSHRTNNDINLIKKGEVFTKISGEYNEDDVSNKLSILLNNNGKKASINEIVQKKLSNYLCRLNVIMFCPDDLEIIKGSPSIRRKFLNIEISQLNNRYISLLKDYNILLKQRNEYLKKTNTSNFDEIYYDVLTGNLIQKNIEIVKIRYEFINNINKYLSSIFNEITVFGNLTVKYKSFIDEKLLYSDNLYDTLLIRYKSVLQNELLYKTTQLGCHKDDFKIYLNNFDIMEFCSQGQQRLAILCLKLAELEVFINNKMVKPIILLDDIFSELDSLKKNNIIKYIKKDVQIFITTTDLNEIDDNLKKDSAIYVVDNGKLNREV